MGRTWNDQPTNATDHVLEWEIPADCRNLEPQRLTASISDASADSPDGEASILIEITDPTEPSVSFTTIPSEIKIFNTETVAVEASDAAAGLANLTLSFASGSGTFTPSSQSFPGNPFRGLFSLKFWEIPRPSVMATVSVCAFERRMLPVTSGRRPQTFSRSLTT